MSKFYVGLISAAVGLASVSCIKKPTSSSKLEAWSPELHSSIELGSGFVTDSNRFVENCTNLKFYNDNLIERKVNTIREYSNLSDSSNANSQSISGSVNLSLGKNSVNNQISNSSESSSRVTVSDDYIFIKRKELTIAPDFLSRVAIKASSVSGAFFNNCGTEYIDEITYGGFLHINMQLNSSSKKDLSSMKSEVSAAPIAWLKGLVANASVEGSISEEKQGLSVELAIDSNMVLTCLNTNESSSNSCSLDNPKACSQLLSKIDSCKSEFRELVAKNHIKNLKSPYM